MRTGSNKRIQPSVRSEFLKLRNSELRAPAGAKRYASRTIASSKLTPARHQQAVSFSEAAQVLPRKPAAARLKLGNRRAGVE
jgi:hypothetical protein